MFWDLLTFNYFQETQEKAVNILPTAIMGEGEGVCQEIHFGGARGALHYIFQAQVQTSIIFLFPPAPQILEKVNELFLLDLLR